MPRWNRNNADYVSLEDGDLPNVMAYSQAPAAFELAGVVAGMGIVVVACMILFFVASLIHAAINGYDA